MFNGIKKLFAKRPIKPVTPEQLTDDVAKRLIGHINVVYYNFDTGFWNTNRYNEYIITDQFLDTKSAKKFKTAMEQEPEFSKKYEFVANVVMTIDSAMQPNWGTLIKAPQYNNAGTAIVGNVIARNKKTGKCELYGQSWIGTGDCETVANAAIYGADRFSFNGAHSPDFRAKLLAAHTR